jgi:hypothetical protein
MGSLPGIGDELISHVGLPKLWSSSDFLKEWVEFCFERESLKMDESDLRISR